MTLEAFIEEWDAEGFEDVPPNAALVIDDAPDRADVHVLELRTPELDATANTLTFTATALETERAAHSLIGISGGAGDPVAPRTFGPGSLFVDDGALDFMELCQTPGMTCGEVVVTCGASETGRGPNGALLDFSSKGGGAVAVRASAGRAVAVTQSGPSEVRCTLDAPNSGGTVEVAFPTADGGVNVTSIGYGAVTGSGAQVIIPSGQTEFVAIDPS
jgi:hypothetical protein